MMSRQMAVRDSVLRMCAMPSASTLNPVGASSTTKELDRFLLEKSKGT